MSVQFILGGSGSGKTDRCLFQIKEALKTSKAPIIYIVPEQYSLEAEKALVSTCENGALTQVNVLSFKRLAFNIFSKCGGLGLPLLDDTGKIMLLRKILFGLSTEMKFFNKSANKQGFLDSLAQLITEFYQYGVTEESLELWAEKISKENLKIKMDDLIKIYTAYKKYAEEHYLSSDQSLTYFCAKLDEYDYLKNAQIWVDGFFGFTPQEYNVLQRLMTRTERLRISLTVDTKTIGTTNHLDPFYETKATLRKLTKIANDTGIEIEKPIILKECQRYISKPEFLYLENNFFKYKFKPYNKATENIVINCASEKHDEISQVAEEISYLVNKKGYRYKDIAIISPIISDYETTIQEVFSLYEIPYFSDKRIEIAIHPLVELINGALEVLAYNWAYDGVFRFLKTGLTPLSQDEIDILENYVLAYGIKGYKWSLEFKFGFDGEQFSAETVNHAKDKLILCFKELGEKKQMTVKEFSVGIFKMLEQMRVEDKLLKTKKSLYDNKQIWKKICTVFEKMVEILGDEEVSVQEFAKILESGIKSCDMGLIPASQDQVIVGDLERTRLPDKKALFIIGANDENLKQESSVISDDERSYLLSMGVELAPDNNLKIMSEQLMQYCALTKPSEYLQLSYTTINAEGKSMRPSFLITKLIRLFPEGKYEKKNYMRVRPTFTKIGGLLRDYYLNNEISLQEQQILSYFAKAEQYKTRLQIMEEIIQENKQQAMLNQTTIKRLYSKTLQTSTSRLERYVKCPFSYFVQYCLNAKERTVFEVKPMDIGSLFHEILDKFSQVLEKTKTPWRTLTPHNIEPIVDDCIQSLTESIPVQILDSKASYQYILKRVKRIANKSIWALAEHIKRGELEPYATEIEFSDSAPLQAISINVNKQNIIKITGRIDRLDIVDYEGNRYVRILDYKSGKKRFDLSDIYFGMQMQLLLYLDALIENGMNFFGEDKIEGKILPGGIFYFNIDDPIIECDSELTAEEIAATILSSFKMTGLVLADKELVKKMDKEISGQSRIIPVYIKKDEEFGSASQVASEENFGLLQKFVINKIKQVGNQILKGDISIKPYKKGNETGCDFCSYKTICGFEASAKANYNYVKKIFNVSEIVATHTEME